MGETLEYIVVDGDSFQTATTFDISDGTYCRVIDIRGRGIPSSQWGIEGLPNAHGGRFQTLNLEPRKLTVDFIWEASSASAAVTRRDDLYRIFKPFDKTLFSDPDATKASLKLTREDSSVRQIDCQVEGAVDLPILSTDEASGTYSGRFRVNFLCPDPVWYDPTPLTGSANSPSSGFWEGNFTGTSWFMYPVYTVTGPATTLEILGYAGRKIELANLPALEVLTIDTNPLKRTIKDGSGDFRYDRLSNAVTFQQYLMEPAWFTEVNTYGFDVTGTGTTGATDISISVEKRYIGA